jgi:hypothetical protein
MRRRLPIKISHECPSASSELNRKDARAISSLYRKATAIGKSGTPLGVMLIGDCRPLVRSLMSISIFCVNYFNNSCHHLCCAPRLTQTKVAGDQSTIPAGMRTASVAADSPAIPERRVRRAVSVLPVVPVERHLMLGRMRCCGRQTVRGIYGNVRNGTVSIANPLILREFGFGTAVLDASLLGEAHRAENLARQAVRQL